MLEKDKITFYVYMAVLFVRDSKTDIEAYHRAWTTVDVALLYLHYQLRTFVVELLLF